MGDLKLYAMPSYAQVINGTEGDKENTLDSS